MMALTKYFVILFLVYLNFDISPTNSAAIPIPETLWDTPDNDNDDVINSENYSTEDDIGKIFEPYEHLYIKNSSWLQLDDKLTENDKSFDMNPEDESTLRDLDEITEPTADDVVESIHSIIDEKVEAKKNRTDRTIVVVVTTNVFNLNGSDDSSKRQHTLLSFGTPGMFKKESSTDGTLVMHNKITSEFFNSNPSPIAEPPTGIMGDVRHMVPVNEAEEITDVGTIDSPVQLMDSPDLQISKFDVMSEGRSFNDDLSNDVIRVMKAVPTKELQEPQDSSVMEAIENILDADVRRAFERDIPQTRHVPLDINIEEEYATLKDLSEYIVEEVPFNGHYDNFNENIKSDDKTDKVKSGDGDEHKLIDSTEIIHKSLLSVTENGQTTTTTTEPIDLTTMEPITTAIPEEATISAIANEDFAAVPTSKISEDDKGRTITTDEFESKVANEQIDIVQIEELDENSRHTFDAPIAESRIEAHTTDDIFGDVTTEQEAITDREPIVEGEAIIERKEIIKQNEITEPEAITEREEIVEPEAVAEREPFAEGEAIIERKEITDPEAINEVEAIIELKEIADQNEIAEPEAIAEREEIVERKEITDPEAITERESVFDQTEIAEPEAITGREAIVERKEIPDAEAITEREPIAEGEAIIERKEITDAEAITEREPIAEGEAIIERKEITDAEAITEREPIVERKEIPDPEPITEIEPITQREATTDRETITAPGEISELEQFYDLKGIIEPRSQLLERPDLSVRRGVSTSEAEPEPISEYRTENPEEPLISVKSVEPLQHTAESVVGRSESSVDNFENRSFDQYPKVVHSDTTKDYHVTNPLLGAVSNDEKDSENLTPSPHIDAALSNGEVTALLDLEDILNEAVREAEFTKTFTHTAVDQLIEVLGLTTTKPVEDVVSEVVKADEETTEQHQIIKKPGVDGTVSESLNDNVGLNPIKVTNVEGNDLTATELPNFQGRSLSDTEDTVDPLRTLVEGVELTVDITKTIDTFQSFIDPNDSIHVAANQVIKNTGDMELAKNVAALNSADEGSVWCARTVYIAGGVLSIGLIVLLGVVSYVRFRQFKRNILFTC